MALTLDGVTLELGKRRVLDGVTATLEPGRVTVILGPNGAGKTSLLRVAAGLVEASGTVAIDGRPVAAMKRDERARAIGYLPQQGEVAWNMTARDVVALGRLAHRTGAAAEEQAIAAAFAATDSAAFADRRVRELSGGERARVLLARVLAGEPRWLLADEPLANLDPAHQLDALAMLRAAADAGTGVVLVLHDLTQAARVADDIVLLKDGRLLAAGPQAAVLTPPLIADAFAIEVVTTTDALGLPIIVPVARSDLKI